MLSDTNGYKLFARFIFWKLIARYKYTECKYFLSCVIIIKLLQR